MTGKINLEVSRIGLRIVIQSVYKFFRITNLDVVEKLRNAEKIAKSQKLKIWENYQEAVKQNQNKEFTGLVTEIFNGDFIMVKTAGGLKKVYFSSIKPPREIK